MFQATVLKGDHVKSKIHGLDLIFRQIVSGSLKQILLFGSIHPLGGMAELLSAGSLDFDKDKQGLPLNDQVDLFVAGPPVALNDGKALLFKISCGERFVTVPFSLIS